MFSLPRIKPYIPLNRILVSRQTLLDNHEAIQTFAKDVAVCPVLKSNAYGHGLKTVAPVFDAMGSQFLVVDSLFEAYELYKLKVKTPILILGYTNPENYMTKKLPFHFTVFDIDSARVLNEYQKGCNIHIFVDTGMCREGLTIAQLPAFLHELKTLSNLKVRGLCSHFADADNPGNKAFSENQMEVFKSALILLEKYGFDPLFRHIAASAGLIKLRDKTFNMFRAGLFHYGIDPLETADESFGKIPVRPALSFRSTLVHIKQIQKGAKVGYGCTFSEKHDMTVGLIPAGYHEGVDRRLSNAGYMKLGNVFCKIVGRVSMNMSVIDISKVDNPKVGQDVEVYSPLPADKNSLVQAANTAGTIPYELLVHLAASVRRILI